MPDPTMPPLHPVEPNGDVVTPSQTRKPWRMRSHRFSRWEFVLRPYAKERESVITVSWNLARWPGHIRLVTPWRVLGLIWVVAARGVS